MEQNIIFSKSEKQTKKIGQILGQEILKQKQTIILALVGELGAGKTTFLKGLAKGLGIKKTIISPTFLIFKEYPINKQRKFYHFDCYRLKSKKELFSLGFEDIINQKKAVIAIEWAKKFLKYLPKNKTILMNFSHLKEKNHRQIIVKTYE